MRLLDLAWITTLCEQHRCGKILIVKIWREMAITGAKSVDLANLKGTEAALFKVSLHRYTRTDKIAGLSRSVENSQKALTGEFGISISGRKSKIEEFINSLEPSTRARATFVIDAGEFEDLDLENANVFIAPTEEVKAKDYEAFFATVAKNDCKGVYLNVEQFTRGYLALAHRFDLETMVGDVLFERHEHMIRKSEPDHMVYGVK